MQANLYQQQPNGMPPPFHAQQHQQQQQQQQLSPHQEPLSPISDSGVSVGHQKSAKKPTTKRKSNADASLPGSAGADRTGGSGSSRSSSPSVQQGALNGQHSSADNTTTVLNVNSAHVPNLEGDTENGSGGLPSKKAARRKGSTTKSFSMDSTPSGLVAKSAHRTSRDGFDPLQVTGRRKNKTDFEIKNGVLNGSANADANASTEEKSDALKQEGASPSPSIQQQQQKAESARSPTPSQTNSAQPRSGKKPHHELLTEAEKKANHIASEQKRRQNIRVGFDSLVEIVPELGDSHRSEAVILQKSVEYIHRLLNQKNELKSRVRELQVHLGDPVDDFDSASDMEVEQGE
ncbi:hypothetical protein BGZ54_002400 [Gamsiella multidivaricata]|nr:hypothetical protein BGZ54_002400 [Gamsiella multidivaricata]